ncbi:MAG: hypothetical protein K0V04_26130, partial [Deltaproteobacteria bacterium]|nr:hypothetical protein [Deltaproteobacteria bacterium]
LTNLDEQSALIGSIGLAGPDCRETLEYRYVAGRSSSRWYNRRELETTWPMVELPAPARTAFPLQVAANVGAAAGLTPSGRGHLQLYMAADVGYRGFTHRERRRDRPSWILALRYFALFGRKEYEPLVPPGWDPRIEAVEVWRHGPAAHVAVRFDQRERASSLFGFGTTLGLGWTTPNTRIEAEGRIPTRRAIPYVYLSPEATFHYRNFRAALLLGLMGPDPTFRQTPNVRGDPSRVGRAPYGSGAWLVLPGFSVGVEL